MVSENLVVGKFAVGKIVSENLPSEKLLSEKPRPPGEVLGLPYHVLQNIQHPPGQVRGLPYHVLLGKPVAEGVLLTGAEAGLWGGRLGYRGCAVGGYG